jgi:hypothetical protein
MLSISLVWALLDMIKKPKLIAKGNKQHSCAVKNMIKKNNEKLTWPTKKIGQLGKLVRYFIKVARFWVISMQ